MVDYLIHSNAKVTTALDLAATPRSGRFNQGRAHLEHLSKDGRTPIMRIGHEDTIEYLIKAGADLNKYSENKKHTVLSFACHSGHL